MSVVPPPSPGDTATRTTLRIGKKHILLTTYETLDSYVLYFGGRYFYCLYAIVSKQESSMAAYFTHETGCLPEIHYTTSCSLEENFRRGIDTTMLVRLAITYIKKTYPYVKILTFSDASYRECDNSSKVELPEMACITTGKTWYETHFGAEPVPSTVSILKRAARKLELMKQELSWNQFKRLTTRAYPLPDEVVKAAYETAATIQDFFLWLRGEIGVPEFCVFLAPWLHGFFHQHLSVIVSNLSYTLPIQESPVEPVEYEESPFRGGKRPTRRMPKLKYGNSV